MNNDHVDLDVSVVLPAYNEVGMLGSTVTTIVTGLAERDISFEVIVVENGSSDGTLRLARMLGAQIDQLRVLTLPVGDYGAALAAGFEAASGEIVVSFDVDYYDLEFLDEASEMIRSAGADIVVASKRAVGSDDQRVFLRRLVTAVFTTILKSGFELPVSDAHGMKAFRRSSVQPIAKQCVTTQSLFDVEMIIRAGKAGLQMGELPTKVIEQRPARSSIISRAITAIAGMLTLQRALGYPAVRRIQQKRRQTKAGDTK